MVVSRATLWNSRSLIRLQAEIGNQNPAFSSFTSPFQRQIVIWNLWTTRTMHPYQYQDQNNRRLQEPHKTLNPNFPLLLEGLVHQSIIFDATHWKWHGQMYVVPTTWIILKRVGIWNAGRQFLFVICYLFIYNNKSHKGRSIAKETKILEPKKIQLRFICQKVI